ncbi:hypothetical protein C0J52_06151 [Blattella germanica]|nr:hypothetical protein C0J52_06151 [Blattella germanica]PSN52739.1 hypothetical protein C0J52_06151 [Blattella germanica]
MAEFTVRQKVQCCYWVAELKFPVSVQKRFRQEYGQDPPERHTITKWHNQLLETGSVLRKKGSGKKPITAARIETVREAFQRSLRKSIRPFFFEEPTVTEATYLNMLRDYARHIPEGYNFQQDGSPPHYSNAVRTYLKHFKHVG